MSAFDAVFRWTFGISCLVHASAFGFVWGTVGQHSRTAVLRPAQDVWVGTTVSVFEEQARLSVPSNPESDQSMARSHSDRNSIAIPAPRPVELPRTQKPPLNEVDDSRGIQPKLAAACPSPVSQRSSLAPDRSSLAAATPGTSVDLKQAMLDASNRQASEGGVFGAAGVDVRERRLPKAFTRALPVAIGAEVGWWRHHPGSLGRVQFEVALDVSGKIEKVSVEDEASHVFLARVVRRVAGLLAIGTFALPASATAHGRQDFELWLEFEQGSPLSITTADPGDLVEKGWDPPSDDGPGKAIIRDALGHTIRAFLKVLPPTRDNDR